MASGTGTKRQDARGWVRALAGWPGLGMSHAAARRAWWLARDGAAGGWTRARLARHLERCPACRADLDPAAIGRALAAAETPAAEFPPARLAALRLLAASRAAESRRTARAIESAAWSRRFAGAAAAACAAGLAIALLRPGTAGRAGDATPLEAGLARVNAVLALADDVAPVPLRGSLDDSFGSLESSIRCLRAEAETDSWTIETLGGDPCADS